MRGRRGVRVLSGLLVAGALALMVSALGVGAGGWPGEDPPESVDGYPQRVERPYVVRDLPAKPGALAGVVRTDEGWWAVAPHGRLWRLADDDPGEQVHPALTGDGRVLVYLRKSEDGSEYVFRDLVSGIVTALPSVGSTDGVFEVGVQQPVFVSPDGEKVLVKGSRRGVRDADALVITRFGVRELFVKGSVFPAGWTPDGRVAWVTASPEPTDRPELVATTEDGRELGRIELRLSEPLDFSQWGPVLSPDAEHISLMGDSGGRNVLVQISLADRSEESRVPAAEPLICSSIWRDDRVLLPGPEHALADLDGDPVVVVDPSIDAQCSIWATDALAGDQHQGLTGSVFGTSTSWLSWRWREAGAGLLLLLAATGLLLAGRPRQEEPAEVSE